MDAEALIPDLLSSGVDKTKEVGKINGDWKPGKGIGNKEWYSFFSSESKDTEQCIAEAKESDKKAEECFKKNKWVVVSLPGLLNPEKRGQKNLEEQLLQITERRYNVLSLEINRLQKQVLFCEKFIEILQPILEEKNLQKKKALLARFVKTFAGELSELKEYANEKCVRRLEVLREKGEEQLEDKRSKMDAFHRNTADMVQGLKDTPKARYERKLKERLASETRFLEHELKALEDPKNIALLTKALKKVDNFSNEVSKQNPNGDGRTDLGWLDNDPFEEKTIAEHVKESEAANEKAKKALKENGLKSKLKFDSSSSMVPTPICLKKGLFERLFETKKERQDRHELEELIRQAEESVRMNDAMEALSVMLFEKNKLLNEELYKALMLGEKVKDYETRKNLLTNLLETFLGRSFSSLQNEVEQSNLVYKGLLKDLLNSPRSKVNEQAKEEIAQSKKEEIVQSKEEEFNQMIYEMKEEMRKELQSYRKKPNESREGPDYNEISYSIESDNIRSMILTGELPSSQKAYSEYGLGTAIREVTKKHANLIHKDVYRASLVAIIENRTNSTRRLVDGIISQGVTLGKLDKKISQIQSIRRTIEEVLQAQGS
jgi:hypothetical protein